MIPTAIKAIDAKITMVSVITPTSAYFCINHAYVMKKQHSLLNCLCANHWCVVELIYLGSVLYKFDQGGELPLACAAALTTRMHVWNNVCYELDNKVSPDREVTEGAQCG
ncbi:conserved hypothetical protein [Ricinus communis]|uniref:K+ potassium transporter integral membrane domain-containing protein n=1 Tax=Ricinus communis TaxID=3988 RepID=B9T0U3_RICCO|nr:conserved hypothetical protein [Ricinus communis]